MKVRHRQFKNKPDGAQALLEKPPVGVDGEIHSVNEVVCFEAAEVAYQKMLSEISDCENQVSEIEAGT